MNKDVKGRIFQDDNFEAGFAVGKKVLSLLALVDIDKPDDQPMILNMELEGLGWQRLFLDAYCGFWEDWGELTDEAEEDETKVVDYGVVYSINGEVIQSAICKDCKLEIACKSGSAFTLSLLDLGTDDCGSVFSYKDNK